MLESTVLRMSGESTLLIKKLLLDAIFQEIKNISKGTAISLF